MPCMGFEGGQIAAAHGACPKRGFNNIFAKDFFRGEYQPPSEGDRQQEARYQGQRSPKKSCARRAWCIRAATASGLLGKGRHHRQESISKWPAFRPGAREAVEKKGRRPASPPPSSRRSITTRRGEPGQAPDAQPGNPPKKRERRAKAIKLEPPPLARGRAASPYRVGPLWDAPLWGCPFWGMMIRPVRIIGRVFWEQLDGVRSRATGSQFQLRLHLQSQGVAQAASSSPLGAPDCGAHRQLYSHARHRPGGPCHSK